MKKIRTHTKGDVHVNHYVPKSGSGADPQGVNHVHYELSPMSKTRGNFDVPTKRRIDASQRKEMDRKL
jgi:hypothetical protein